MRVAFRVDASSQMGTGHFMRCLTLADALKQHGAGVRFLSRHLPDHFQTMLLAKGFGFQRLEDDASPVHLPDLAHAHWLGTTQQADAQESMRRLSGFDPDWLVVDHYALDARWESLLRQTTRQILVIDDIADRPHDCDVLLDQNFYADMETRYVGQVPAHCRLLLGPHYALLRDEFRALRQRVKPRTGPVKRVLVFFGGADADNHTGQTLTHLIDRGIDGLQIDVVIGAQHPCRVEIEAVCQTHRLNCHVQTSRMAELMAVADMAIGAGGATTWERCCLGVPAFVVCLADNQRRIIADAAARGWLHAFEPSDSVCGTFLNQLGAFMRDDAFRQTISDQAMQAVDGCGTWRVLASLGCSGLDGMPGMWSWLVT